VETFQFDFPFFFVCLLPFLTFTLTFESLLGGRGGGVGGNTKISAAQLDKQLDAYMAKGGF
jgi:C-terminal duplication domain of Friend of PRMT1